MILFKGSKMIRFLAWQVMDNPFEGARQRHASAIDVENRRLYITGGHLLVGRPSTDVEVYFVFKACFQIGMIIICPFNLIQWKPLNVITDNVIIWLMRSDWSSPK
jgi:hypothetical protein